MDERDGQHMGVVTKAFVNDVPPSSMILRVLFITCNEPGGSKRKEKKERITDLDTYTAYNKHSVPFHV